MEMDMRWIMKCTGLLCAALLFALCPVVTAGIITVPGDAGAIKDAIALAQDGDEVEIAPGAYTENGIVVDKDIAIRSKTGTKSAARVTIDGSEKTVFTITGAARLIGLDITNAQTCFMIIKATLSASRLKVPERWSTASYKMRAMTG
ncbi:hypothetical protein [Candidatus Jettenia sp. AMX1]|uniref:hypothetical protein n=1 Tax=Candidatus Jettenia sp. AMX1 TaxID=2293637 RepID=UPI002556C80E|nr:hypothetical protein [Candidatus Jettenia sp. AMX1]